MDALVGPGVEVVKCAGPPILRQIRYCFRYKKNVENLRKRVRDLSNTRTELQARVNEAQNNLESIKKSVLDWFESVDKETTRDETILRLMNDETTFEMINQQCCQGWCCCRARWNIGRDSQKKMPIIEELLNQGKSIGDNVSDPSPPVGTRFAPTNEDFEDFESRKSSKNQIMTALKDDKTSLVGVYGMGGVGKTMLVNQVHKLVMKEKLFDAVAKITVSETVDLKKIQNEIANQLGCLEQLKKAEDTQRRAEILRVRLTKQNQKIIVILDDMWTTELGLSDVGIPYRETCCKVVITTRSIDVCNSLGSHKNIEVGVLTEEESWLLFKKNVGEDVVNSPVLLPVARDVAKECGRLPIALVTIGRALKNKDKTVWTDTTDQLKSSDYSPIEEINPKVSTSIKLSYDQLGNPFLKKCFLLCSMFPEDHRISIVELMMHVMGDDEILKNMAGSTLEKVRDRLHNMLDKLMASCLLFGHKEDDGRISEVWMHDIVRYVALTIASEEGSGFLAKVGVGLKEWPESWRLLSRNTNTSKCLRVSLMRNEISVLPEQPEVPGHLLCLSLEGNRFLKKTPDSFFQKVESLATLNLSETGNSSLPSSLSCLVNLRSLHLGNCDLHGIDISIIGKLKKLEILNLSGSKLSSLPEEIGGLSNLKLLDLSGNRELYFIPPNVISRLSRLEELYMFNSFERWKVQPTEDGSRASLDDVAFLISSLKSVQLEVHNDEIKARISTDPVFRKWHRSRDFHLYNHNDFGSYLTASSPICHSIRVLLARVDDLKLSNCTGLKSVGQLVTADGFNNMKILAVEGCNEMEHLIALDNLKVMPARFLDKLEQVDVLNCQNLVSIFSPDVWVKLKNLQGLRVEECKKLKEVFYLNKLQDGHVDITFTKLKVLCLESLPELTIIWKGFFPIESLQYLKVMQVIGCHGLRYLFSTPAMVLALEQLEALNICNCDGMEGIVAPPEEMVLKDQVLIPPQIFPNLMELKIYGCNSLKDLYPLTKLSHGGLSQLRRLEVTYCKNLEEIFLINTDEEEDNYGKAMLPQLEILEIKECKALKAIIDNHTSPIVDECDHDDDHQLNWSILLPRYKMMLLKDLSNLMTIANGMIMSFGSFENLEVLEVVRCNSLKHILPIRLLVNGGLPKLKKIVVEKCNEIEVLFNEDGGDHSSLVAFPNLNWSILLPRLKMIFLDDLPNLMAITKGVIMSFGSFQNLEWLSVKKCNIMKHLLPIRLLVNGGLPKLKLIRVEECNEMEVIFNEDGGDHDQYNHSKSKMVVAFPHLKELTLVSIPKLSKFHQGPPILDWPSLQDLYVSRCENLKRLPFNHTHSLPKLKVILGDSERWFDEELEWEDESLKSRLRPFLHVKLKMKKRTVVVSRCC